MKNFTLFIALVCAASLNTFAQFSFIHISDMHVSDIPFQDSDTNAQYFRCYSKEFTNLYPRPDFVVVSGDISNVGNQYPDGMYPILTQYLFPPALINPGIGDYFIDSAKTIPIYFVPGNHEYWVALVNPPVSNDTLPYYKKFLAPDIDYSITNNLAVIVFLRSGPDTTLSNGNKKGKGLSDEQCTYLRNILSVNSNKRKIIIMHHPAVNAIGTNPDGTPFTGIITGPDDGSIVNNRTNFLNICDSNHVDVVLNGHEHQNVVANRAGKVINENGSDSTRYVQTAAAFNRSYRIITLDSAYVTVSAPMRSCNFLFGVNQLNNVFNFTLYPNPASDRITIDCTESATIEVINEEGQLIQKIAGSNKRTTLDLTLYSSGIYIVKAMTDKGIAIKKFSKP